MRLLIAGTHELDETRVRHACEIGIARRNERDVNRFLHSGAEEVSVTGGVVVANSNLNSSTSGIDPGVLFHSLEPA